MTFRLGQFLLLFCALTALGCHRSNSDSNSQLTVVRVQTVAESNTINDISYSVSIVPYTQVNMSFKVSGYIEKILQIQGSDGRMRDVQQNDKVVKGTLLAQVQPSEYLDQLTEAQASLAKANAGLSKANDEYLRARNLYATQSLTQREFDQARKEYDSYKAEVTAARAQADDARLYLAYTKLRVPWDGVILQRNVEVGSLVAMGTVGFVLANIESVKATVGVPDTALNEFQLGDSLRLLTKSLPNTPITGIVTEIGAEADSQTRLFGVELTISNADGRLKPGMIARLNLPNKEIKKAAISVPLSAVVRSQTDSQKFAVFVVDSANGVETAALRDIEIGDEIYRNQIAVLQGLTQGERVVVNGAQMLADAEPVKVIP